jgi:HK97 gp10 family phage protein
MVTINVVDNSDLVMNALPEQIEQALVAIGIQAESNAVEEVDRAVYDTPKARSGYIRTGRLRNSITHEVHQSEKSVYVGASVKYAKYVEFGTSNMWARPYLKPAIMNHIDEYKSLAEQALKG